MKNFVLLFCLMASNAFFAQNWQQSYSEALARANAEDKPIILVFAGSDWCGPCIKMDRKIWQSAEFKDYSEEDYILYKADFPRKRANKLSETLKAQNDKLAEKYNHQGYFPLVLILDSKGAVLDKTGYIKDTPAEYVSYLKIFLK